MNISVFFLLVGNLFFHSIHAKKITPQEYVDLYKEDAVMEMKRSGVPASITLAQGMLESGYGNSELAKKANNHFGIKCHSTWTGSNYLLDDDKKDECFRKYKTVLQSYKDHSDFLRGSRRYSSLFELKMTDYKGWCKGLKKAGYATNKKYAVLLIDMIERYDLNRFVQTNKFRKSKKKNDSKIKPHTEKNDDLYINIKSKASQIKKSSNWIKYVEVKHGDTYYNLSRRYSIPLSKLYRYNDCNADTLLKIGTPVYLQPKRLSGTQKIYLFKKNDDIYRVSQRYGIRLKQLYKKNKWIDNYIPKEGEKVFLRGRKK